MNPRTELYIMREFKTQALNNIDVWKYLSGAERALVALVDDHAASSEYWD